MKLVGLNKFLVPVAVVAVSLFLTACGNTKYAKQTHSGSAAANLYVTTKPKIDVIVFQDDSDSVVYGPLGSLKPHMNSLVTSLSNDWDVHFIVLPMLYDQNSLTGKYVVASNCSEISGASGCFSVSQANDFNNQGGNAAWLNNAYSANGNLDYGLYYMQRNLGRTFLASSGFLRSDAALATIVISNGEDSSVINLNNRGSCYDGNGMYNPSAFPGLDYCNFNGSGTYVVNSYSNSLATYYNSFYNYFGSLKGGTILRKMYSIVANGTSCWGYGSVRGSRYISMAQSFGINTNGDLCNSSGFSNVMNDIRSNLQTVVEAIRFNYVVISADRQPVVSSIKVYKNGVEIPQSSSNGWTYVGNTTQATSYYPTSGNVRSGYMIKLNGSAVFQGSDSITFDFDPL